MQSPGVMRSPSMNRRRKGEVMQGSVASAVRGAVLLILLFVAASLLFSGPETLPAARRAERELIGELESLVGTEESPRAKPYVAGRMEDLVEGATWDFEQARAPAHLSPASAPRPPLTPPLQARAGEVVPHVVPDTVKPAVQEEAGGERTLPVARPVARKRKGAAKKEEAPRVTETLTQPRPRARADMEDPAVAVAAQAKPHTSTGFDPRSVEVLSLDKPRAFLYRNFMTDAEVEHMIEISKNGLSKSGVVDATTGGSTISDIRTSSGAFVGRGSTPIVSRIEERIALWSQIPASHGEAIQVLRYEGGQEYRAHFDYFFHKQGMANNRVATVLLYLSDVEEGGETVFPNAPALGDRAALQANWSACARQGLAVKPVKGNALLFWSMKVGGELDGGSSHAGCPVIKGTKWTATKWMHVGDSNAWNVDHKVYKEPRPSARPGCEDKDDRCWSWAEQGECKKNAGFMAETCKASCGCGEGEEE